MLYFESPVLEIQFFTIAKPLLIFFRLVNIFYFVPLRTLNSIREVRSIIRQ
jgi:hypothetical protein